MATSGAGTRPLFTVPRILAGDAGPAGTLVLRPADPLGEYPATVVDSLRARARADPDHLLVAERDPGGAWRGCGYGAAVAAADEIGQALLDRGLGPGRSAVAVLAELDADEITDKGYVNQRRVLACRAALAEMLYADPVPDSVVVAGTAA